MAPLSLDAIRACLEGVIPANVATCSADGVPNATYVSHMQYVDTRHVALSFQFFNKTRENVLVNPRVTALVADPVTAVIYRLELLYLHTESAGALFENMRAKLAGVASHTGMAQVFRLHGADIYRVLMIERLPGPELDRPPVPRNLLNALRQASARLVECRDLERLVDQTLTALDAEFDIRHAMLLIADEDRRCLYTVGSRGYPDTGVGSEIAFGDGVIGVAAQYRTPIRISHMTLDYRYGRAAQDAPIEALIPFPGLPEPHSQLAVPIPAAGRLVGVLCVESPLDMRFSYDDEDALVTLAAQLGAMIHGMQQESDSGAPERGVMEAAARPDGKVLEVRHYKVNDSVFVDGDYLIKGVPGAILRKLLKTQADSGRCDFSNRELRMANDLRLPEISDNLEARLILLRRRLAERCPDMAIERTGRGLFRLRLDRPVRLVECDV